MRRLRAFTLIELIVVILILGILAAVAVVGYTELTDRANMAATQADLKSLTTATLAQAALAGDDVITRDTVKAALEVSFGATVVVVGTDAAQTWTLLPADGVPEGPHEIAVGFVGQDGEIGDAGGTQAVFVTVTASGKAVAGGVATVGGTTCPVGMVSSDGGVTWSPADIDLSQFTCGKLDPMVEDPDCGSEWDSAYWQGYDTASWHRSAHMGYDVSIPEHYTFGEACVPDFIRGYDDSFNRPAGG